MTLSKLFTLPDRQRFFLVWLACLGVIAGFFFFQEVLGLPPCKLCYYERVPFYMVAGAGILAWFMRDDRKLPLVRGLMFLSGMALVVNIGVTGYHVGVEQKWWPGPSTCSGVGTDAQSVEDLLAAIQAAPVVRCDETPWELFGISLAGYGFLISLALSLYIFLPLFLNKGR